MSHRQSVIERIEIPTHINNLQQIIDEEMIPKERILKMYKVETAEEIKSIITTYPTKINVMDDILYFSNIHELTESYHLDQLFYTEKNRIVFFDQSLVKFPSYYIVQLEHRVIYHVCLEEFSRLIQMDAWVSIEL
ncbi:hypothetical protein [Kurthia gibsonii]|uniref:hypothetical protein n=1 Tax=Kurthia gibsonii TaxID=33946 RepID=UPI002DBE1B51|nr:hypothetical protein [Kurthia gibsonii]MEB7770895.1 hypothetical protein [Kurthia gibsonii]